MCLFLATGKYRVAEVRFVFVSSSLSIGILLQVTGDASIMSYTCKNTLPPNTCNFIVFYTLMGLLRPPQGWNSFSSRGTDVTGRGWCPPKQIAPSTRSHAHALLWSHVMNIYHSVQPAKRQKGDTWPNGTSHTHRLWYFNAAWTWTFVQMWRQCHRKRAENKTGTIRSGFAWRPLIGWTLNDMWLTQLYSPLSSPEVIKQLSFISNVRICQR